MTIIYLFFVIIVEITTKLTFDDPYGNFGASNNFIFYFGMCAPFFFIASFGCGNSPLYTIVVVEGSCSCNSSSS
jgi:hypothetical protein